MVVTLTAYRLHEGVKRKHDSVKEAVVALRTAMTKTNQMNTDSFIPFTLLDDHQAIYVVCGWHGVSQHLHFYKGSPGDLEAQEKLKDVMVEEWTKYLDIDVGKISRDDAAVAVIRMSPVPEGEGAKIVQRQFVNAVGQEKVTAGRRISADDSEKSEMFIFAGWEDEDMLREFPDTIPGMDLFSTMTLSGVTSLGVEYVKNIDID